MIWVGGLFVFWKSRCEDPHIDRLAQKEFAFAILRECSDLLTFAVRVDDRSVSATLEDHVLSQ